jgi:aconitate hydratase
VQPGRLHTFGARRGHWEVMLQGAFTNPSLRNELVAGAAAGRTVHFPTGEVVELALAASRYAREGTPLVIVAGRNYGAGSSRDDAAKSTRNLGVRAVIAESFERIHRSNLLALGVLPLAFERGVDRRTLGLRGDETIDVDLAPLDAPGAALTCRISGRREPIALRACIDTGEELAYWRAGGLLAYLLRGEGRVSPPRP